MTTPQVHKPTILGRIRAYFFAGILITAPIGITLYLTWSIIDFFDRQVIPYLPAQYNPATYLPITVPGLGLILAFVVLTMIGWLTAGLMGRWFIRLSENLLARMPVVRSIYSAVKQVLETVLSQRSDAFRQCVLVEYPRRGLWTIGFITGDTTGEVQNLNEDDLVNVYVPTTPNPTSGFLLFIPRRDIHILSMSVEEGFKMVVSTGLVTPKDKRTKTEKERKTLVTKEPTLLSETPSRVVSIEQDEPEIPEKTA